MSSNEYERVDFELYRYTPSLVAAIIFIVLFALATAYHLYQVVRTRFWYFTIFVLGGACEFSRPDTSPSAISLVCAWSGA